jgi:hypothetical protein
VGRFGHDLHELDPVAVGVLEPALKVSVFVGLPFMFMASFRRFINFDPAKDTVESVR